MTQFTLTHHMVNKPFLLLGLVAKYRSLTVAMINVAADHHMFVTLTGERSWHFYSKHEKNRSLSHPLGHLGVTYALHLWLVGKPVVDFIFVVIEIFSLYLTCVSLREIVQSLAQIDRTAYHGLSGLLLISFIGSSVFGSGIRYFLVSLVVCRRLSCHFFSARNIGVSYCIDGKYLLTYCE